MTESNNPKPSFGLRNFISKDSQHFQPESGRYHLYVSYACPFAHRALLARKLKGLEDHIGLSVTHPVFQKTKPEVDEHRGWVFRSETDEPLQTTSGHGSFSCKGCIPDTVNNAKTIRELYDLSNNKPERYTVPVLWDKKNKTIVNNESPEVLRMIGTAFNDLAKNPGLDLYPEHLRAKIDELSEWVQNDINTAVYKAGFAQNQQDYDKGVNIVFDALEKLEEILSKNRYACGNQLTETDIRLFPTLIRFDEAYYLHFKCNKKRIVDYPNILNYCRDIYQIAGVAETVDLEHVRNGYYANLGASNPYGIVPVGPDFISTLKEKHSRETLA